MLAVAALAPAIAFLFSSSGLSAASTKGQSGHTHAHPVGAAKAPSRARTETPTVSPIMTGSGPPYTVRSESVRLFDASRMTPARGTVPAAPGRLLVTDLYVPVGAAGPRPLVVFAHGWNSNPGVYEALLDTWATAGFIVAAPIFPDSTDLYPGSPVSDYADQARDVSFVITSLVNDHALPIDPTRIAVAGHSDGGTDVALLALDPAYADTRVRAYVCLSGEMPSGVATYSLAPSRVPLLVAVGTNDEYGLYPLATSVFQQALTATKAMLVEQGGDHLGSFVDATPEAAAMRADTTLFLELALEPRPPNSAAVVAALDQPTAPGITVVAPGAPEPAGPA